MSSPPSPPALRDAVFERLCAAFGEPQRVVNLDRHWALRSLAYIAAINVLCDGKDELPVVWVFNPHDPTNGVHHSVIRSEAEIDPVIADIERDVRHAGRAEHPR